MIVLVPPDAARAGSIVELDETEEHHLRVRRAAHGEAVELRDGVGLVGLGRLRAAGRRWEVEVDEVRGTPMPPPLRLAVGAGDRDRFGWLVEKATELGVTEILPLETERTAGVADRLRAGQLDRLRRRAREAIKQCGAAWAPAIAEPVPLTAFLERVPEGVRWLADAAGAPPPEIGDAAVTVVVGPEGGLAASERERLLAAGFTPVRLGAHVLRFETAALAAATVIGLGRTGGSHG